MLPPRMSRRRFLRLAAATAVGTPVVGAASYWYGRTVGIEHAVIEEHPMPIAGLDPAFNDYRMVQLSDLHADDWMDAARLSAHVATVNDLSPDVVVITGDFVTRYRVAYGDALRASLRDLTAPDGVYAVAGNHDHWSDITAVRAVLRDAAIGDLSNTVTTLRRGGAVLHLAGLDDVWVGAQQLATTVQQVPPTGAAIILVHEPDYADTVAQTGRFAWQLSGHTHGGQVVLPLVGAPVLPYLGRMYPAGHYTVGTMQLYTNRGLGSLPGRYRIRLNCRPEITLFRLRAV